MVWLNSFWALGSSINRRACQDKLSDLLVYEAVEYLVIKGIVKKKKVIKNCFFFSSVKHSTIHKREDVKWTHTEQK